VTYTLFKLRNVVGGDQFSSGSSHATPVCSPHPVNYLYTCRVVFLWPWAQVDRWLRFLNWTEYRVQYTKNFKWRFVQWEWWLWNIVAFDNLFCKFPIVGQKLHERRVPAHIMFIMHIILKMSKDLDSIKHFKMQSMWNSFLGSTNLVFKYENDKPYTLIVFPTWLIYQWYSVLNLK